MLSGPGKFIMITTPCFPTLLGLSEELRRALHINFCNKAKHNCAIPVPLPGSDANKKAAIESPSSPSQVLLIDFRAQSR